MGTRRARMTVVGVSSEAADVSLPFSVSSRSCSLIIPHRTYQDGVGNHRHGATAADEEAAPKRAETRSGEGGEARARHTTTGRPLIS
jgi:hypothetical protein